MVATSPWNITYYQSTDNLQLWPKFQQMATDTNAALTLLQGRLPNLIACSTPRVTNGTATTTTEVGFVRMDSIPVVANQWYKINSSPIIFNSTVANDLIEMSVRVKNAAVATNATVADTHYTGLVARSASAASSQETKGFSIPWQATTTGFLSIWFGYNRSLGTGSVNAAASSSYPAIFWVELASYTATLSGTSTNL